MPLYKGCKTAVSLVRELSSSFPMKVGVHQGSALSPLLFIMAMDVLTKDVRDGLLMKLLCADDRVLWVKCLNEVMDKYGRSKKAVKEKDLRINVDKQKLYGYCLGRKVVFLRWTVVVSVVSGLVVIQFDVRNVRGGFIAVLI